MENEYVELENKLNKAGEREKFQILYELMWQNFIEKRIWKRTDFQNHLG